MTGFTACFSAFLEYELLGGEGCVLPLVKLLAFITVLLCLEGIISYLWDVIRVWIYCTEHISWQFILMLPFFSLRFNQLTI